MTQDEHPQPHAISQDPFIRRTLDLIRREQRWTADDALTQAQDPAHLSFQELRRCVLQQLDAATQGTYEEHIAVCDYCLGRYIEIEAAEEEYRRDWEAVNLRPIDRLAVAAFAMPIYCGYTVAATVTAVGNGALTTMSGIVDLLARGERAPLQSFRATDAAAVAAHASSDPSATPRQALFSDGTYIRDELQGDSHLLEIEVSPDKATKLLLVGIEAHTARGNERPRAMVYVVQLAALPVASAGELVRSYQNAPADVRPAWRNYVASALKCLEDFAPAMRAAFKEIAFSD